MSLIGPEGRKQLKLAARFASAGFELAMAIVVGYLGGRWLDEAFETAPILQYIESLSRFPDAPRMSNAQREALDLYYAICEEPEFCLRLQFERGDIQFLHNHVIFHSRTGFEDWPEPERRRHLIRMWLSLPDGRVMAPAMAEKWINIEVGTRRGGVPTTAAPVIPVDPFTRAYA